MYAIRTTIEGGTKRGGQGLMIPCGAWLLVESVIPPIAQGRWPEIVCVADVQDSTDPRLVGYPVQEAPVV